MEKMKTLTTTGDGNKYIIKGLLEQLEAAEKKANELDGAWEKDFMNEDLEKEWDEAYKKEFDIYVELIRAIVVATDGKVDADTAKRMIMTKREKLKEICSH